MLSFTLAPVVAAPRSVSEMRTEIEMHDMTRDSEGNEELEVVDTGGGTRRQDTVHTECEEAGNDTRSQDNVQVLYADVIVVE